MEGKGRVYGLYYTNISQYSDCLATKCYANGWPIFKGTTGKIYLFTAPLLEGRHTRRSAILSFRLRDYTTKLKRMHDKGSVINPPLGFALKVDPKLDYGGKKGTDQTISRLLWRGRVPI